MSKEITISPNDIENFLQRAQLAHFRTGSFAYEGWNVLTRELFRPESDPVAQAKQIIRKIRAAA